MSELHLDSLEIENFRCFEHLVVEKLGRVNLIVGKNSVGKTALLEAIRIFANRGNPSVIFDILGSRNETDYSAILTNGYQQGDLTSAHETEMDSAIKYLFNGRYYEFGDTFRIGSSLQSNKLDIGIALYAEEPSDLGKRLVGPIVLEEYDNYEELVPRIFVSMGKEYRHTMPLFFEKRRFPIRRSESEDTVICQFIPVNGLDIQTVASLWERVSLTNLEIEIVKNLTSVVPDLSRLNLIGYTERSPSRNPFLIAKIKDQSPIPLKSLGDGLYRAFGIGLALVNSQGGLLLIDEFETGLHHSVQTDIWRMMFETAKRLNVQVFATTHSWDCVAAFQEASTGFQEEARLIRLQGSRDGSTIEAESYNYHAMKAVIEQGIEVR